MDDYVSSFEEVRKNIKNFGKPQIRQTATSTNKYSTFPDRIKAYLIDSLFVFSPIILLRLNTLNYFESSYLTIFWIIFSPISFFTYRIITHSVWGFTFGKNLCGIKVLDTSGNKLTLYRSFLRDSVYLAIIIASLPSQILKTIGSPIPTPIFYIATSFTFFGIIWIFIDFLSMLANKKMQTIHDFLAQSVVIKKL